MRDPEGRGCSLRRISAASSRIFASVRRALSLAEVGSGEKFMPALHVTALRGAPLDSATAHAAVQRAKANGDSRHCHAHIVARLVLNRYLGLGIIGRMLINLL